MKSTKHSTLGVTKRLLISVLASMSALSLTEAATVAGTTLITINNSIFSSASKYGMYVEKYWGPNDNSLDITKTTTGGATLNKQGSTTMYFPVNVNTTTRELSPTCTACSPKSYGRTLQATTLDTNDTSTGQIGLSGAWRLNSALGMLTPYDFSLSKSTGNWIISTYDSAFKYQEFIKLTDVSESFNAKGELSLSGNLKWSGSTWPSMMGVNTNDVIGSFHLIPIKGLTFYDAHSGTLALPDVQANGKHYALTLQIGQTNAAGHFLFSLSQAFEQADIGATYPVAYDTKTELLTLSAVYIDGC